MQIALEEAIKGEGWTNPNPMVGAVIVKENRIIGKGYHEKYGEPHAERNAIANCKEDLIGSTMYVTLEPCCHYGKTPPCTEAIIEAGISKVVIGTLDPNPLVAGKGVEILKNHGIEVEVGVLEKECVEQNKIFFHYVTTKMPYVVMKYAMTADGKIAAYTGKSKWITGESARAHVHYLRHKYAAIMVGVGTVISDDPMLNCRIDGGNSPIRIICDTNLRTPLNSKVVTTAREFETIIATCISEEEKIQSYIDAGCRVITVSCNDGHLDLHDLMKKLGELKIDSILLEGGAELNYSALSQNIVNEVKVYMSSKILGGRDAKSSVGGQGALCPDDSFKLKNRRITPIGEDILIEWEVE
jgi:diaminohydroxyphosphoribosylaminopyrimidine deaminase/5-amino-6-(5-phosphoribosylamino)uracil reductase